MANIKDHDEMQHDTAFHQGLDCLLRLKQPSGTEIHDNLEMALTMYRQLTWEFYELTLPLLSSLIL